MRNTIHVVDTITNKAQDIIGAEKLNLDDTVEVLAQLKDWTEQALKTLKENKE